MSWFDLTYLWSDKPKPKDIYDEDGNQIGDYYPNEPKQKVKQKPQFTHQQKILIRMSQAPDFLWTISSFQQGNHFIGYEAPTRLWELKQKGLVERNGNIGAFAVFKITQKGKEEALTLIKEIGKQNI